jgi:hypothetical protein
MGSSSKAPRNTGGSSKNQCLASVDEDCPPKEDGGQSAFESEAGNSLPSVPRFCCYISYRLNFDQEFEISSMNAEKNLNLTPRTYFSLAA